MSPRKRPEVPSTRRDVSLLDEWAGRGADNLPALPTLFDPSTVTGTDAERLAALEAVITAAQGRADTTVKAARDRFVLEAGPALAAINGDGLYCLGEHEGRTFETYVKELWGYSRTYAYQLMDAVPVVAAVSAIADTEVRPEHVKALAPTVRALGEEAARQQWMRAKEIDPKVTGRALRTARQDLGYVVQVIPSQQAEPQRPAVQPSAPPTALVELGRVANALTAARRHVTRTTVAEAFEEDSDGAERVLEDIRSTLKSLGRLTKAPSPDPQG